MSLYTVYVANEEKTEIDYVRANGLPVYRLVSVVCHHGYSLHSGHYTAFTYDHALQCWYYCSDDFYSGEKSVGCDRERYGSETLTRSQREALAISRAARCDIGNYEPQSEPAVGLASLRDDGISQVIFHRHTSVKKNFVEDFFKLLMDAKHLEVLKSRKRRATEPAVGLASLLDDGISQLGFNPENAPTASWCLQPSSDHSGDSLHLSRSLLGATKRTGCWSGVSQVIFHRHTPVKKNFEEDCFKLSKDAKHLEVLKNRKKNCKNGTMEPQSEATKPTVGRASLRADSVSRCTLGRPNGRSHPHSHSHGLLLALQLMPKEKRKDEPVTEIDHVDKHVASFSQIAHLIDADVITRLTLSHNKISVVPANIADLVNLQVLTLWNNQIEELPPSISSLPKLRILNLGMNRLSILPRGFGSFPALEVLDLTYNNLSERSLPGNFFFIHTLRALYLGDNDFEMLPGDVENLANLQILALRDNDLLTLPRELGRLTRLRELHIQGNRLTTLPPELGNLDLIGPKQTLRLEHNPWVPNVQEQFDLGGAAAIWNYIRSENYKYFYGRQEVASTPVPPKKNKDKKISRKGQAPAQ
ncbi:unnamed protein product [Caenorhabditis auriculariae]|uniref:USP domain-containing protein n=1 Tax=Caenorhabditis auriculariae TaxID=2777116 RepID=A0A8S1GQL3_9PELO|nr:unnamed protein product [Caenorhabditis auriculariae]